MDDIKLAQLGDKEAAARLTEQGVLLPCPRCGNPSPTWGHYWVYCEKCFTYGPYSTPHGESTRKWNTRAPILSESEMKKLEEIL